MINCMKFDDRLKAGALYERRAYEILNNCVITYQGHTFLHWNFADETQDIHQKIDFITSCTECGDEYTAQFKHRESGTDIICAAYMPYPDDVRFRSAVEEGTDHEFYDRDLRCKADLYISSNADGLFIAQTSDIHYLVRQAVDEMVMCARNMQQWKWFNAESGVQLLLKQDLGGGYSEDMWKLIAYVPRKSVIAVCEEYVEIPC